MPRGEYDEIAKAHYESIKEQTNAYNKKRSSIYEHYYTSSATQNKELIDLFYLKTKEIRQNILNLKIQRL